MFYYCANCPRIYIPSQELDKNHYITRPMICFNVYHLIAHFLLHGRCTLDKGKTCRLCLHDPASIPFAKLYTRKEIIMMEKSITEFNTSFYITAIKKLVFHLKHIHIIGTHHCRKACFEVFKHRISYQYVLCCRDYSERVIAIFVHKIQYEYYGVNISVFIE